MRAVRVHEFGGLDALKIEEVPVPEPLPTEVLVRVQAAGVNPADWKQRAGMGFLTPPFTLGWDVAGVVERTGFGVTTLQPRDRVYGMLWFPREGAAYAEYVTAPSRQFAKAPGNLDAVPAAAVPLAALTAWQTLVDTAHIQRGQRVLIHAGAGGVGHLAVQIAVAKGASVITTVGAEQEQFVRELGATQVIDYRHARFENEVSDVDAVLDLVGSENYGVRSVSVLRPDGIYIGVPSGIKPKVAAAAKDHRVRASEFLVEPDGAALTQIAGLFDSGAVKVQIAGVYPLAQVADAHRQGEAGHAQGKLVLAVNP
jgi:NADPH:quinone reductase-like Zn-dependent oxidoreductase